MTVPVLAAAPPPPHTRRRWRDRFGLGAWVGFGIVGGIVLLSIVVPFLSSHDPMVGGGNTALAGPSLDHWFGTDHLGRDVFTRTFAAGRLDVVLALIGVSGPLVIGTVIGAVVGTTRSSAVRLFWETAIEAINVFPTLVIVIGLVAVLGAGVKSIMIALFCTAWARYAKVSRGRALAMRQSDFMLATECLGYSRSRVILRHVIP